MEWNGEKFNRTHAKAFLATVEEGSLAAAARAMGMTQPVLGRQVAALEDDLGVALFDRAGAALELTEAGDGLLGYLRTKAGVQPSTYDLGPAPKKQADIIRIAASEIYAAYLLPPILPLLREKLPNLTIDILPDPGLGALTEGTADIALLNAMPEGKALIARKIAEDFGYLFATEEMVEAMGDLSRFGAVQGASFVGLPNNKGLIEGLHAMGLPVTADNFVFHTASHLVHWEMAKQGAGIGIVPVWLGDAARDMARVNCGLDPISYPVWLVARQYEETSRTTRLVFDTLAQEIPRLLG